MIVNCLMGVAKCGIFVSILSFKGVIKHRKTQHLMSKVGLVPNEERLIINRSTELLRVIFVKLRNIIEYEGAVAGISKRVP